MRTHVRMFGNVQRVDTGWAPDFSVLARLTDTA
jgi:hypothetical protein